MNNIKEVISEWISKWYPCSECDYMFFTNENIQHLSNYHCEECQSK